MTIKSSSKRVWPLILMLVAFAWTFGCAMSKKPLVGWHSLSLSNFENNKAISDDFHAYVNSLPLEVRNGMGPMQFYEDGTGQHAVLVAVAQNGTDWGYILIYDKSNKRTKATKYVMGHYRS